MSENKVEYIYYGFGIIECLTAFYDSSALSDEQKAEINIRRIINGNDDDENTDGTFTWVRTFWDLNSMSNCAEIEVADIETGKKEMLTEVYFNPNDFGTILKVPYEEFRTIFLQFKYLDLDILSHLKG